MSAAGEPRRRRRRTRSGSRVTSARPDRGWQAASCAPDACATPAAAAGWSGSAARCRGPRRARCATPAAGISATGATSTPRTGGSAPISRRPRFRATSGSFCDSTASPPSHEVFLNGELIGARRVDVRRRRDRHRRRWERQERAGDPLPGPRPRCSARGASRGPAGAPGCRRQPPALPPHDAARPLPGFAAGPAAVGPVAAGLDRAPPRPRGLRASSCAPAARATTACSRCACAARARRRRDRRGAVTSPAPTGDRRRRSSAPTSRSGYDG